MEGVPSSLLGGLDLIDCLPYIDEDDPQARAVAEQLVQEEMGRMQKAKGGLRDYLANKPAPAMRLEKFVFVQTELEKLAKGKPPQPLDEMRYQPTPPSEGLRQDLQAWRGALNNVRAQCEHDSNRMVNMEVLQTFAKDVWLVHNAELEKAKKLVEKERDAAKKQAEQVILLRQTDQEREKARITNLSYKRDLTIYQNLELQKACALIRQDVKRLKSEVGKLGIEVPSQEEAPEDL